MDSIIKLVVLRETLLSQQQLSLGNFQYCTPIQGGEPSLIDEYNCIAVSTKLSIVLEISITTTNSFPI
jgi:hypothetical protein